MEHELYMIMVDGISVASNVDESYLGAFIRSIFETAKYPEAISVVVRNMKFDNAQ